MSTQSISILNNFHIIRPEHEIAQSAALDWLVSAHAASEKLISKSDVNERMRVLIKRFACQPPQIQSRGSDFDYLARSDFSAPGMFGILAEGGTPEGADLTQRLDFFSGVANRRLREFYPIEEGAILGGARDEVLAPEHLIHVSCTGYIAPSAAQNLVALRGWKQTAVTHAYHMGCYAALPAIRMAQAFVALGLKRVDVVHTELCTLHLNPSDHSAEQIVVQSLFADGHIRYSVQSEEQAADAAGFEILAVREQILPDSLGDMTWVPANWGMKMTLSREVPAKIGRDVLGIVEAMIIKAGLNVSALMSEARFAVHPGGPKIVETVKSLFFLRDSQVEHSRNILASYGNMSSATLPHVWQKMFSDQNVKSGEAIISLAFGPGLTVFSSIMRKR